MPVKLTDLNDKQLSMIPSAQRKVDGKPLLTREESLAKQEMKLEKELHNGVIALLQHRGVQLVGHARMDRKSTFTVGWPDITFAYRNHFILWELKLPGQHLSADQIKAHRQLVADGWEIAIIHSITEARNYLEQIKL